jgi:hypothetical protein
MLKDIREGTSLMSAKSQLKKTRGDNEIQAETIHNHTIGKKSNNNNTRFTTGHDESTTFLNRIMA